MAANNYFGFTHGTPQYAAAAYQAPQAGYAVAPAAAAAAATYTTQRAATGYDYQQAAPATYVAATSGTPAATYDYSGYARAAPGAATAYDATKTYYQQPAPAPAQPQTYASTDYQAVARAAGHKGGTPGGGGYANAGYTTAQAPAQATYTYTAPAAQTTGASFNGASVSYTTATANYSTSYPTQNHNQTNSVAKNKTGTSATWQGYKKAGIKQMRPKTQPKPQQLHYCEVCKISCAGPQTYREHLEGQRHKKKEALQKEGGTAASSNPRGSNNLRCELCDVVCTGSDAYAAHLRGAKHQKVVKLHTKLGKPIPEVDMKTAKAAAAGALAIAAAPSAASSKISFIQSGTLGTVKVDKEDTLKDETTTNASDIEMLTSVENEITPVGQEYIEEIKNEEGKLISFNCKLCECKFNDPNAKDMHMKGRRHRLQFKRKVNPDLIVDVKPSGRRGRMQEEKMKRRDDFIRRRDDDRFWTDRLVGDERLYWEERRRFEEEMEYLEWMRRRGGGGTAAPVPPPAFMQPLPFGIRRPDTIDDRHFMAKHQVIFPKEERLQAILKFTSQIEKALKLVCDQVSQQHNKSDTKKEASKEDEKKEDPKTEDGRQEKSGARGEPLIRGVIRVGNLPKNLMLVDDYKVNIVIISSEYPTKTLLTQIFNMFQTQVKTSLPDETLISTLSVPEGCFMVSSGTDLPKLQAIISLTSPIVRDLLLQDGEVGSGRGTKQEALIDETKCLEALAQLRRTKWFQGLMKM